jgi:hypothetical protein
VIGWLAVGLLASGLLTLACTGGPDGTPQRPSPSAGISVPTGRLPPDIACLVERGFRVVEIEPPQSEGDDPGYILTTDLPPAEARLISEECATLAPQGPEKTDEELRAIHERWLDERTCLVDLGYRPDPPPSVETFIAQWRSPSGPWMPIDGIDVGAWTDDQYREAKERCTLEMFERD